MRKGENAEGNEYGLRGKKVEMRREEGTGGELKGHFLFI